MAAMGEYGVALGGNADAGELAGHVVEAGDFDTGDIVEITCAIAVAAYAVGRAPDLAGDGADIRCKPQPLSRYALIGLEGIAFAEPGNKQGGAVFEAR